MYLYFDIVTVSKVLVKFLLFFAYTITKKMCTSEKDKMLLCWKKFHILRHWLNFFLSKVYWRKEITFFHLIRINDISNFKVTSFKKTFKGFVKVFWMIRQLAYWIRKKYRHVKSKQILCRIFCNSNLEGHELNMNV